MHLKTWVTVPILWLSLPLWGQSFSQQLDTVAIEATRLRDLAAGHRQVELDSLAIQAIAGHNLADLLAQHSDVFVKSYGLGNLATTSLRGGSASHTAVVWNGFTLTSPMNGQLDLSLLPAFFLDRVAVQYGGSAALFGSGAVGGALHLDNQTGFDQGLQLRAQGMLGSFGRQQQGLDATLSQGRWLSRTRFYRRQAQNDFSYRLPNGGGEPVRQTHAANRQWGLLQEAAVRLGEGQQLRLWAWQQAHDREIPPTLSQAQSQATQQDRHTRLALAWRRPGLRLDLQARSGFFRESLYYRDPAANLDAPSEARRWLSQAEAYYRPRVGHTLHLGLDHQYLWSQSNGYGPDPLRQQRWAVLASYRYQSQRAWEAVLSLRQGYAAGRRLPLIPSLGGQWQLWPWLELRGQVGKSFRLPTFNDRYWVPGGNPALRPETSWGQELGLHGAHRWGKAWKLRWGVTGYHRLVRDWILWRPTGRYWSPENLRRVRSRGLETELRLTHSHARGQLEAYLAYTLTRATVQATEQLRDASLGQQLIYTPPHQGRTGLTYTHGAWRLAYHHRYVGRRYTTSDNSRWLPPYQLADLSLSRRWSGTHGGGLLALQIDNLWNQAYQVLENRPMPGRSISLRLEVFFTHLTNQSQ